MKRPVRCMSIALDLPTARVSRWVPPMPGDDAEVDLGLAELRGVGGDDEVAHHRQLAAAAQRIARDGGDDRLADPRRWPRPRGRRGRRQKTSMKVLLGHLLDVGPGGKGLFRPGEDDAAHLVVGVGRRQRGRQFAHQLRRSARSAPRAGSAGSARHSPRSRRSASHRPCARLRSLQSAVTPSTKRRDGKSSLAGGAAEGRPAGLHDARDRCRRSRGSRRARLRGHRRGRCAGNSPARHRPAGSRASDEPPASIASASTSRIIGTRRCDRAARQIARQPQRARCRARNSASQT